MNLKGSHQFTSLYSPGQNIVSLRMDANNLESFVLVYEDYNHQLFAFAGDNQDYTPFSVVPIIDNLRGTTDSGLLPDVAMSKTQNYFFGSRVKLFFSYIDLNKNLCYVKEGYLGELMSGAGSLNVNKIHEIKDYFGHEADFLTAWPKHTIEERFFPIYNDSIEIHDAYPVYGGLYGPLIDAPDNSLDNTWAVIVEQVATALIKAPYAPPPFNKYNIQYGTIVAAAIQANGMAPIDKVLNLPYLPPLTFPPLLLYGAFSYPDPFVVGIPGGVNMAFRDDNLTSSSWWFEPMYAGLPAVAFTKDGNNIVFAWGKTKDVPMLNDHEYIALMMDIWGNVMPGNGGEVYRLIDFDPSLNPYHKVVALSGENVSTNDLYTIFTADVQVPTYSECLYQKHPEWTRLPQNAFRPADIDDKQMAQKFFKIYPSPFRSQFILSLSDNDLQNEYQMTMTDIFGKVVFRASGNATVINQQIGQSSSLLQQLSSGMYLIRLDDNGQSQSIKIIKD